MVDINEITVALDRISNEINKLKELLRSGQSPFEILKQHLNSDKWPVAVEPALICNDEEMKLERGRGIIDLIIQTELKDKRFLDYGCGEGHVVKVSHEYNPAYAVGYDIKEYPSWVSSGNTLFTTSFDEVAQRAPYDIILLFDVLDHSITESPVDLLKRVKSLLAPDGTIHMRCHPFTSRHATHAYNDINRGYMHLIFTPEEIQQLIPTSEHMVQNIGVTRPILTYQGFIESAGLKIVNRYDVVEPVSAYFKNVPFAGRIIQQSKFSQFPEFQMSVQFLDYILKLK